MGLFQLDTLPEEFEGEGPGRDQGALHADLLEGVAGEGEVEPGEGDDGVVIVSVGAVLAPDEDCGARALVLDGVGGG